MASRIFQLSTPGVVRSFGDLADEGPYTLTDAETKTAAQIREFLKQAREALATGDTDGAHTLANKAKVLLSELNPQS